MAIEGLLVKTEPAQQLYFAGRPNVAEAVGVTLEAYQALGYQPDVDRATETLTADFQALTALGYAGRLFVKAPAEVSFDQLVEATGGMRPAGIDSLWRYPNLWVPGTEAESYTAEELNHAPEVAVARLALYSASKTDVDPLLHHLDAPFDDYARQRWGGDSTQLDEIEKDKAVFAAGHPDFALDALDHRDFALLALMGRIRGVDTADQILSRGYMWIADLPRRLVDGDSVVGDVSSDGGQRKLDRSSGAARSDFGVGLSVGQNSHPEA